MNVRLHLKKKLKMVIQMNLEFFILMTGRNLSKEIKTWNTMLSRLEQKLFVIMLLVTVLY